MEAQRGNAGLSIDNYAVGGAGAELFGSSPRQLAFSRLVPADPLILNFVANEYPLGSSPAGFRHSLQAIMDGAQGRPGVLVVLPLRDGIFPRRQPAFTARCGRWRGTAGPRW